MRMLDRCRTGAVKKVDKAAASGNKKTIATRLSISSHRYPIGDQALR
jgi:hypothetical protein